MITPVVAVECSSRGIPCFVMGVEFEEITAKVLLWRSEPDTVIKRAVSGSRAVGSRRATRESWA